MATAATSVKKALDTQEDLKDHQPARGADPGRANIGAREDGAAPSRSEPRRRSR